MPHLDSNKQKLTPFQDNNNFQQNNTKISISYAVCGDNGNHFYYNLFVTIYLECSAIKNITKIC